MNINDLTKKVLAKVEQKLEDLKFDSKQIEKGIAIEEEHKDTILQLIEDVKSGNIKSLKEYYKMITLDHLNETDNYYIDDMGEDRLHKMEEKAKAEKKIK